MPDMSAFDQAASIAAQYGGNFGAELAKMSAASILGSSAPVEAAPAKVEEVSDENLGDL